MVTFSLHSARHSNTFRGNWTETIVACCRKSLMNVKLGHMSHIIWFASFQTSCIILDFLAFLACKWMNIGILTEDTPIRTGMFHQRIKLMSQNNFVLIYSDPTLLTEQMDRFVPEQILSMTVTLYFLLLSCINMSILFIWLIRKKSTIIVSVRLDGAQRASFPDTQYMCHWHHSCLPTHPSCLNASL